MVSEKTKFDLGERDPSTHESDISDGGNCFGSDSANRRRWNRFLPRPIRLFVLCSGMVMCAQAALAIYTKGVLTSIEKRFEISSSLAGFIVGSFNIGNILFVVAVSKLSGGRHRPRIMAFGSLLIAVGGFINAIPHLLNVPYQPSPNSSLVDHDCGRINDVDAANNPSVQTSSYLFLILILGEIVQGIGATVHIPISSSYIDDFASSTNSPVYLGISFVFQNLGPGFGYLIGAWTSTVYVDFDRIPSENVTITAKDRTWIGAWWLGYLVIGTLVVLAALPLFLFPKNMKKEKDKRVTREYDSASEPIEPRSRRSVSVCSSDSTAENDGNDNISGEADLSDSSCLEQSTNDDEVQDEKRVTFCQDFCYTIKRLITNPVYVLVIIGYSGLMFVVGALTAFMPKFLQEIFRKPAGTANLIFGLAIPPLMCVGLLSGGIIVNRRKWTKNQMLRYVVICSAVALVPACVAFFISCSPQNTVCDHLMRNISVETTESSLTAATCHADCDAKAIAFVVVVSLAALIASNMVTPIYTVVLRSVAPEDKCTAIGVMFLVMRVLGLVPAPIIAGAVIDGTCSEWKVECGENKNCQVYDIEKFRFSYLTIIFLGILCSFVFTLLGYLTLLHKKASNRNRLCSAINACKSLVLGESKAEHDGGRDAASRAV